MSDGAAAVLADFQQWLGALAAEAGPAEPVATPIELIDLHTLLANYVALRQEVNLQTRATRAQQEQNAEALRVLQEVVANLRSEREHADSLAASPAALTSPPEDLRPLLKTVVDLYDALAIAGREARRVQDSLVPLLDELEAPPPPVEQAPSSKDEAPRPSPLAPRASFWRRLFGASASDADGGERLLEAVRHLEAAGERLRLAAGREQAALQAECARRVREAGARVRQVLASLVTGYTMSLQRLERALRQHGLEPIPAVGQNFDPHTMEVLDVAPAADRPAGEVLEEIRRGYLWNGRVFRHAQVKVAKT
jgi:molecular chaperone GrpE